MTSRATEGAIARAQRACPACGLIGGEHDAGCVRQGACGYCELCAFTVSGGTFHEQLAALFAHQASAHPDFNPCPRAKPGAPQIVDMSGLTLVKVGDAQ